MSKTNGNKKETTMKTNEKSEAIDAAKLELLTTIKNDMAEIFNFKDKPVNVQKDAMRDFEKAIEGLDWDERWNKAKDYNKNDRVKILNGWIIDDGELTWEPEPIWVRLEWNICSKYNISQL